MLSEPVEQLGIGRRIGDSEIVFRINDATTEKVFPVSIDQRLREERIVLCGHPVDQMVARVVVRRNVQRLRPQSGRFDVLAIARIARLWSIALQVDHIGNIALLVVFAALQTDLSEESLNDTLNKKLNEKLAEELGLPTSKQATAESGVEPDVSATENPDPAIATPEPQDPEEQLKQRLKQEEQKLKKKLLNKLFGG